MNTVSPFVRLDKWMLQLEMVASQLSLQHFRLNKLTKSIATTQQEWLKKALQDQHILLILEILALSQTLVKVATEATSVVEKLLSHPEMKRYQLSYLTRLEKVSIVLDLSNQVISIENDQLQA